MGFLLMSRVDVIMIDQRVWSMGMIMAAVGTVVVRMFVLMTVVMGVSVGMFVGMRGAVWMGMPVCMFVSMLMIMIMSVRMLVLHRKVPPLWRSRVFSCCEAPYLSWLRKK